MMGLRFARPVVLNTWVNASRVTNRLSTVFGPRSVFWDDVHTWLDQHVRGHSFVDIGTMWGNQWGAFDAEARGATPVTALDITPPTDECRLEQERRGGSNVRFVTGDVHDPEALEAVGMHDVVLCSGVLYHCPSPLLTLECLRRITRGHLLLATKTVQEIPGFPQACIFYPGLAEKQRLALAAPIGGLAVGLHTPFDPAEGYGNFWWGISRSALHGMLVSTGWDVVREKDYSSPPGFLSFVIARPNRVTSSTSDSAQATIVA